MQAETRAITAADLCPGFYEAIRRIGHDLGVHGTQAQKCCDLRTHREASDRCVNSDY
jgi:hypothetical protein